MEFECDEAGNIGEDSGFYWDKDEMEQSDQGDVLVQLRYPPLITDDSYTYPGCDDMFDSWTKHMGPLLLQEFPDLLQSSEGSSNLSKPDSKANQVVQVNAERKQWVYRCNVCGSRIEGGKQRFDAHLKNSHQLQCLCGDIFNTKVDLQYHIHVENELNKSSSKFILSNSSPSKHECLPKKLIGRPPFECESCDETFTKRTDAMEHRKTEHLSLSKLEKMSRPRETRKKVIKVETSETVIETKQSKGATITSNSSPLITDNNSKRDIVNPVSMSIDESFVAELALDFNLVNHANSSELKPFGCLLCNQYYLCKKPCSSHLKNKHPMVKFEDYKHYIEDNNHYIEHRIKMEVPDIKTNCTPTTITFSSSGCQVPRIDSRGSLKRRVNDCGGKVIERKKCTSRNIPTQETQYLFRSGDPFYTNGGIPSVGLVVEIPGAQSLPTYSSWAPNINQRNVETEPPLHDKHLAIEFGHFTNKNSPHVKRFDFGETNPSLASSTYQQIPYLGNQLYQYQV